MAAAVVLLSGGLDSCVAAAVAAANGFFELALLHASYGQRTQERERRAFEEIADFYGVAQRLAVQVPFFAQIGGSALTDAALDVPQGAPGAGIPATYVPFRNTHLIAMGVSWAEVIGAKAVYIGANELDSSGYPDCRRSYLRVCQRLIAEGTRPESGIEIKAPLIELDKAGIVRLGLKLGAPLHLTWSCYTGQERACGRCESCLLRLRGFAVAGGTDPLPYE
ncbi:MAG: 7-cyano-7-deazaguanine synthase QueC [Pseudomonadota bacterium]